MMSFVEIQEGEEPWKASLIISKLMVLQEEQEGEKDEKRDVYSCGGLLDPNGRSGQWQLHPFSHSFSRPFHSKLGGRKQRVRGSALRTI